MKLALTQELRQEVNMKIIGVMNHKGGVGKTFISVHLAKGLGDMMRYNVLAVDFDVQGDLMKWGSGGKWEGEEQYDDGQVCYLYSPNVIKYTTKHTQEYDFVVIDARPNYDAMSDFLEECDVLFIPLQGRLSFDGAMDVFKIRQFMQKGSVPVWIIRNMMPQARDLLPKENKLVALLENTYDVRIGHSCFSYTEAVRMAEAQLTALWYLPGNMAIKIKEEMTGMLNWVSEEYGDGRTLDKKAFDGLYQKAEV
jgi:MinD-like ATPase involved in chromosome partitioning or flagellar assembly